MTKTATKEHPILFNGPMVRAILDGRKTQTRRVIKPQPIQWTGRTFVVPDDAPKAWQDHPGPITDLCPYGVPGDRLYVQETWAPSVEPENHEHAKRGCTYRADWSLDDDRDFRDFKWKPSIHMPRWASRITLEVKRVWVERVQEISEEDAIAEGAEPNWSGPLDGWKPEEHGYFSQCPCGQPSCECTNGHDTAREWFQELWDSINTANGYGWDANPWVWCVEFERVEGEA